MADTNVRNLTDELAQAFVSEHNKRQQDLLKLKAGTIYHAHGTAKVTAVDGNGTLAKLMLIANDLKAKMNTHAASACSATTGVGTHLAADATNFPEATVDATDLGTAETLLNSLYTKYNTHLTQAGKHCTNDTTNAASSAAATDQASSDTRANDLKLKFNLHIDGSMNSSPLVVTGA